ncbi:TPA: hypothetical protein H1005_00310 [archaeon]|uniref:Uncharacterized protein n=1 Tax=Candidatus Naiadarchaeum limnaeum TaxID=2756139 RepID=A0A832X5N8_9ARCH|nr:hypothetical protein [Candidatus Naiadarchaeales archaeon SRR2090153.bin1042]HIJ99974.1 hypothetical protein [Candidatus Naiadarchaeum limnaeum]
MRVKILILALVLALVLGAFVVSAQDTRRADKEKPCVAQPDQNLGIAAITEGIGFIMAGGLGPILMLVIAFIIGLLVSHAFWSTF